MSRATYRLGGPAGRRWMTRTRMRQIIVGAITGVVSTLMLVSTQQIWFAIPLILGGAVAARALIGGDDSLAGVFNQIIGATVRRWVSRLGRWDSFDPSQDRMPWWLQGTVEKAVTADGVDGDLGFLDLRDAITVVLEVNGDGEGVRPDEQHQLIEHGISSVLQALSPATLPVDQIDVITRSVPSDGAEYQEWVTRRLAPGLPDEVRESMEDLTRESESIAETFQSYVVARMPIDGLAAAARERGVSFTATTIDEQALQTVGQLARLLNSSGVEVIRGLSSTEKAALIRSMWVPSLAADDLTGIDEDDFWSNWPRFDPARRWVVATGPAGDQWYHATAGIPRTGYPEIPVSGRWLEPLVFAQAVYWRTVVSQYRVVAPEEGAKIAADQLTTSKSKGITQQKTDKSGAAHAVAEELSVGDLLVRDLTVGAQAGVRTTTRVMISAPNPTLLNRFREDINLAARQKMAARNLVWDDHRHTVGALTVLPLGMEVPA